MTFKAVEDFKVDGAQKIQIELDVIQPITKSKRAAQIPVPVTLTDPMDVASFEGLEVSICSNRQVLIETYCQAVILIAELI